MLSLRVCVFVCLLACLLACLFACLLVCLFVRLLACLFVCLFVCLKFKGLGFRAFGLSTFKLRLAQASWWNEHFQTLLGVCARDWRYIPHKTLIGKDGKVGRGVAFSLARQGPGQGVAKLFRAMSCKKWEALLSPKM